MGMAADSGRLLVGIEHLRQSVRDILTTRIGTRVMRRDYGSDCPGLVDAPMTPGTLVHLYGAAAKALRRWEPRLRLSRLQAVGATPEGRLSVDLKGEYLPIGETVSLEGIIL